MAAYSELGIPRQIGAGEIATLIPAYKIQFIAPLFAALQSQTYKPAMIIVSDDSPGGVFRKFLESAAIRPLLAGLKIYICEGPRTGAYENCKHLLRVWNGATDLVHVLLDDDVIYPDFYEKHRAVHLSGGFSCSISHRWFADENGSPTREILRPAAVMQAAQNILSIPADVAFMTTIPSGNWFGEFSNTIFRAEICPILFEPEMAGISYAGLWDLGAFLAASLIAPIAYIRESLGYFRLHGAGHSAQTFGPMMKTAFLAFPALAISGQRLGKLSEAHALQCYENLAKVLHENYTAEADLQEFCTLLPQMASGDKAAEARFIDAWADLLASYGLSGAEKCNGNSGIESSTDHQIVSQYALSTPNKTQPDETFA